MERIKGWRKCCLVKGGNSICFLQAGKEKVILVQFKYLFWGRMIAKKIA